MTHHNAHEYWRETQYIMIFVYGFSVKWRHFLLGSATAHAHWHTFMPCVQPRSRAPRPPPALATERCKMYNFSRSEFCQFYRFMALVWTWKVCLMRVYLFQIYQTEPRMPRVSILRVLHSFKVFLWSLRILRSAGSPGIHPINLSYFCHFCCCAIPEPATSTSSSQATPAPAAAQL